MAHFNILSLLKFSDTALFVCLALFLSASPEYTFAQASQGTGNGAYAAEVKAGDDCYNTKDYGNALMHYRNAGILNPAQKYPQERIGLISDFLKENKDLKNSLFEDAILKGENFYQNKDYPSAQREFRKALEIDPEAQYPKDKLALIRQVYTDPGDAARYNDAMLKADKAMVAADYDQAKNWYQIALTVDPDARQPREKILEADKLKAEAAIKKSQYDKFVNAADKLIQAEKRAEARAEYQKALDLLPNQTYAVQRVAEIDAWLNERKKEQEAYDRAISQADQFYISRDFTNARVKYQEALKVKPNARYPKDMLDKTSTGEAEVKSLQQRYDAAIASADNFYKSGDMDAAMLGYRSASGILPGESYPRTRIAEIEKSIGEKTSRKEAYDIAIMNGDQAFQQNKPEAALAHYKNALTLLPDEKYPADKIAEINALLLERNKADESYKTAIATADLKFREKKYEEAATGYQSALALKPGEKYPQDQLNEIDAIYKARQDKEDQYKNAVAAGDRLFAEKDYNNALDSFRQAEALKPAEKYPKDKMAEINRILQEQKQLDNTYQSAVAAADKSLAAAKYTEALTGYRKALDLKPAEEYPAGKIKEIDSILAGIKLKDENYVSVISRADQLLADSKYTEAIGAYNEALQIKPAEKYPRDKIAEAESALARNKALEDNYQSALTSAEKSFSDKKYPDALAGFQKASTIKPSEQYPLDKITEIKAILDDLAAKQVAYEEAVTRGDKLFAAKDYEEAIASYRQALVQKPEESYPANKIAEINTILNGIKATDDAYAVAIADADSKLAQKQYGQALAGYNSALGIKPGETYPAEKITEINSILAGIQAVNDAYEKAITEADRYFGSEKYAESIAGYNNALTIKPGEKYPADKITEAGKKIADLKARQESYEKAVAEGDRQLASKAYTGALAAYNEAISILPAEKYPTQKIAEINTILDGIKAIEDKYNTAIANADAFYNQKKYREALEPYESAATIKPAETYPKQQIDKINQLLAEQKKRDDDYTTLLVGADKAFAEKQYHQALSGYRGALEIKPEEQYPKDKIDAINGLLAEIQARDEAYNKALAEGDAHYTSNDYQAALTSYRNALTIKSGETYPAQKIDDIEARLKETDNQYNKNIAEGDARLAAREYPQALNAYQQASEIKPEEKYPREKIDEINKALALEKEQLETMYAGFITEGDRLLAGKEYPEARSAYNKASGLKPAEQYPKDKLAEINKILQEQAKALKEEYDKAIVVADNFYRQKVLDQAIESYEKASAIKPDETYPGEMIRKIKQYITDHAIKEVNTGAVTISAGEEKKFSFAVIEPRLRKNNYVLIHARATSGNIPKVFLNYGRDAQKNGGIVLRTISPGEGADYLVRLAGQDRWYREDNNWISIYTEGSDVEISRIQISQGDE